jgi:hypothetical protein
MLTFAPAVETFGRLMGMVMLYMYFAGCFAATSAH